MEITPLPKKLRDLLMEKAIEKQDVFIFIATPYSMMNKDRVTHCAMAEKFSKMMYAVVKRGLISRFHWRKFKHFPWRAVYMFKTEEDLDFIIKDLLKIADKEAKKRLKKSKKEEENVGYA